MKKFLIPIERFFFTEKTATGFGLMRVAWGLTTFVFMALKLDLTVFLFSRESGFISADVAGDAFRSLYRFTLLEFWPTDVGTGVLYIALLVCVFLSTIGLWTRITTVLAVVLLFSFHEANLLWLGGGETMLRALGLILAIAPGIDAISVDRLRRQWKHWTRNNRTLLAPKRMPLWPERLLLWQLIIVYVFSGWEKATGTMWWDGTAVSAALHNLHFTRPPLWLVDALSPLSPILSWSTLVFEFSWLLLFLPLGSVRPLVRRGLLLGGTAFHGGIFLMMKVGAFSQAMLAGYLGLLRDEDFTALRRLWNRRWRGKLVVIHDGNCGHCERWAFSFKLLDAFHRLELVNYHEAADRKRVAPDVPYATLDKDMHVKLPNGKFLKGFDAIRRLTWHLPAAWPMIPFLYIPGVPQVGRRVYRYVADHRCNTDCAIIRG